MASRTQIDRAIRAGFPHAKIKWSASALNKITPDAAQNILSAFTSFAERMGKPHSRYYVRLIHLAMGHYQPSVYTRYWMAWTMYWNRLHFDIGCDVSRMTDASLSAMQNADGRIAPWHVSESPDEWILHELGHVHHRSIGVDKPPASVQLLAHAGSTVSSQASFGPQELYAELFAAQHSGTAIPPEFAKYMEGVNR